jgi:hypothetical protein
MADPTQAAMTLGRFRLIYEPESRTDRTAFKLVSDDHSMELCTYNRWAELLSTARALLIDVVC